MYINTMNVPDISLAYTPKAEYAHMHGYIILHNTQCHSLSVLFLWKKDSSGKERGGGEEGEGEGGGGGEEEEGQGKGLINKWICQQLVYE